MIQTDETTVQIDDIPYERHGWCRSYIRWATSGWKPAGWRRYSCEVIGDHDGINTLHQATVKGMEIYWSQRLEIAGEWEDWGDLKLSREGE